MSGSDEYSFESKIGKITINTVLCFIQENIGSCSKDILLEAVIKNFYFDKLKLASLQLSDDFKFTNKSRRSAENYAFDLYNNIDSLIEKDFTLKYVVKVINKLPKCIPSTIDPFLILIEY